MELQQRRLSLQNLLSEKVNQLNQIEGLRINLTNEIIEIRGKLNLLDELISQEKNEKEKIKEKEPERKSVEGKSGLPGSESKIDK